MTKEPETLLVLPDFVISMSIEPGVDIGDAIAALRRGECFRHGRRVVMVQIGSAVYGDCGCRLYHGTTPPAPAIRH